MDRIEEKLNKYLLNEADSYRYITSEGNAKNGFISVYKDDTISYTYEYKIKNGRISSFKVVKNYMPKENTEKFYFDIIKLTDYGKKEKGGIKVYMKAFKGNRTVFAVEEDVFEKEVGITGIDGLL